MPKLKVCELFAGVGGFRLGLEATGHFEVVWSNQWEPSTKTQHASMVYEARFGSENHSNKDIEQVPTDEIPDHDLLVGGFPCQDYSVATTLKNSKGLIGKKGVLWWSIHRILKEKKNRPKYLFLENVDRLLKSPSTQRGRDFAIMLKSLSDLGYAVEWRVLNAADYGMPQRRRRVFFLAYHESSSLFKKLARTQEEDWLREAGVFAKAFPVGLEKGGTTQFVVVEDLPTLSETFNRNGKKSPFKNAGVCVSGNIVTKDLVPDYSGPKMALKDILQNGEAPDEFFIPDSEIPNWAYLKGAKKELRTSKSGHQYHYTEGSMVFPDALDKASRTIITGEGGKAPSRFKHVVQTKRGLRRLTPIELERLNMFPDDHTKLQGISDSKRAFFMGNALVVGVVEKVGVALAEKIGPGT
ncbi:MAG: DNA (cytosine-5-)-methyltransferase [Muricauda sp.]|nr:DNA (cytosine-5-)-methyltransferase [Allomuricauda sp.]MAU27475.1 DNA (cytosine-5-)-methyltransferase [Allomuricauda sp.]MBC30269.1 DNA (cytosine-5-)-methyltransferase [Allomuricauda sp.]|tara:strand:- start:11162 stop:12394 length:1233 start_codon:yes stop_codon:yes gene_type:complete